MMREKNARVAKYGDLMGEVYADNVHDHGALFGVGIRGIRSDHGGGCGVALEVARVAIAATEYRDDVEVEDTMAWEDESRRIGDKTIQGRLDVSVMREIGDNTWILRIDKFSDGEVAFIAAEAGLQCEMAHGN